AGEAASGRLATATAKIVDLIAMIASVLDSRPTRRPAPDCGFIPRGAAGTMGRVRHFAASLAGVLLLGSPLLAQTGANVLVVVNGADRLSRHIGDYYVSKRSIPLKNICK